MGNKPSGLKFTVPNEDSAWPRGQLVRIKKPATPIAVAPGDHFSWTAEMDCLDGTVGVVYDNCEHGVEVITDAMLLSSAPFYTFKREWLAKIAPSDEDNACAERSDAFFASYLAAITQMYSGKSRVTKASLATGALVICDAGRRRGIVLYTGKKNGTKVCVAFVADHIIGKISEHDAVQAPNEPLTEDEQRVASLAVSCLTVETEKNLAAAETQAALHRQTLAAIRRRERVEANAPY